MRRTALVLTMALAMVLACAGVVLAQEETTNSTTPEQEESTTFTAPEQESTSSSAAKQQYMSQHTTTGRVRAGKGTARPDLHISKSVKPKVVKVGQKQTFTVKVTNQRNQHGRTATGLKLTDPLPKNVRFVRATTSRHVSGSCSRRGQRGQIVECRLGNLKVGHSTTVKIVVKAVKVGTYTNRVILSQTRQHNDSKGNNKGNQGNAARRIGNASAVAGDHYSAARVGGLTVIAQH
jgi:uncharacterized repeat protein (TIGR01451 family)